MTPVRGQELQIQRHFMRPVILLLISICLLSSASAAEHKPQIGDTIGELRFKDIRGLQRSLNDFGKKKAYVFVFTTTQCPLVRRTIPKVTELEIQFRPKEVQFVAVNVGVDDSIRDM